MKVTRIAAGLYEVDGYTVGYYQGDTLAYIGCWEIRDDAGDLCDVFNTKRDAIEFLRRNPS